MGGKQSKRNADIEQQPIKWRSDSQRRVIESLHKIHQPRYCELLVFVHYNRATGARKTAKIYTWYGRPEVMSQDKDRHAAVYQDSMTRHKFNRSGRLQIKKYQYQHSMIDIVLPHETRRGGWDTVTLHWYKPGYWSDQVSMAINLRPFTCTWVPPDRKGDEAERGTFDVVMQYPEEYTPLVLRAQFEGNTTEMDWTTPALRNKSDMQFYYGRFTIVKPGEAHVVLVLKRFLDGRPETGQRIKDEAVKVFLEVQVPPDQWSETLKNPEQLKKDRDLEASDFKDLLLWQRPLPRSFPPETAYHTTVRLASTRLISLKDSRWSVRAPTKNDIDNAPRDSTFDPVFYNRT